jgi:hypothetical protein
VGFQADRAGSSRVGGKYSDEWHTAHLKTPRDVVPESIMPSYMQVFPLRRAIMSDAKKGHTPPKKEIDSVSGVETTGHDWDGIKELNNPAPRWWLWVFYICVIWADLVTGWFIRHGRLSEPCDRRHLRQWTQYDKLAEEQAEMKARQVPYLEKFEAGSFAEIMKTSSFMPLLKQAVQAFFQG